MSVILGFGYKANCGKDTAANYLKNVHGWYKTEFAKNLKDCLSHVFGFTEYDLYSTSGKEVPFKTKFIYSYRKHMKVLEWMSNTLGVSISELNRPLPLDALGTQLYTPRQVLQFIGTEIMRYCCENYHIVTCLKNIPSDKNVVISDVRFPNEANYILSNGGFCVNIKRDISFLCDKDLNHKSEVSMLDWDGWYSSIDNNGSFNKLYESVDNIVENITNGIWRQCS